MIKKTKIPEMGCFAIFVDTESNQFGLFELNK